MPDQPLTVVAVLTANEGSGDKLYSLLSELSGPSNAEPGCQTYICHRNIENPDELVVYEIWDDENALEVHAKSDHFLKFIEDSKSVLKDLEIKKLR